jgi:hypothetical protein
MDAMRSRRVDDFCPARRIVMNGSVGSIKQLLLLDQPALLPFPDALDSVAFQPIPRQQATSWRPARRSNVRLRHGGG